MSQRRISYPPVNISEGEDEIVVTSEIPGMDTEDIELTLNEKSLVIRGTKRTRSAIITDRSVRPGVSSGSSA